MMLFSLKGNVITSLKNVGYHISAFSAQSSPHIKISFFSPIGFPRGYAIGIPSTLGFPRYHGFSSTLGFPRYHGFSKESIDFQSIGFPRRLYLIHLSIYPFICLRKSTKCANSANSANSAKCAKSAKHAKHAKCAKYAKRPKCPKRPIKKCKTCKMCKTSKKSAVRRVSLQESQITRDPSN